MGKDDAITLTSPANAPVLAVYVDHTQDVLNKALKAIGDGSAESIKPEKLRHPDGPEYSDEIENMVGKLGNSYKDRKTKVDSYHNHLTGLDADVALIATRSAGISNVATNDIKALGRNIQGILRDVPADPDLQTQLNAIAAIHKAVGDTEDTVTKAHNKLAWNADGVPPEVSGYDYRSPAVAHNGSGGYNAGYTNPVAGSVEGSTAKKMLNEEQIKQHIGKALDALGIKDPQARANWTKGYLTLIQRESGGNAGSINTTDSNAAAGHASQGLTQTIPGTFKAYHVDGTSNTITDPTANIASSMNYVMDRYDVSRDGSNLTANVQQADASRQAKGY